MEQALEMMLYECAYSLKWGAALIVVGILLLIVGSIISKRECEGVFMFLACAIGIPLLIVGAALFVESRYNIRRIEMYPEAAYYQYYGRDIDVNIKYPTH